MNARRTKTEAKAIALVRNIRWEFAMIGSALAFLLLHFSRT